jgi:hypothetical protein
MNSLPKMSTMVTIRQILRKVSVICGYSLEEGGLHSLPAYIAIHKMSVRIDISKIPSVTRMYVLSTLTIMKISNTEQ